MDHENPQFPVLFINTMRVEVKYNLELDIWHLKVMFKRHFRTEAF